MQIGYSSSPTSAVWIIPLSLPPRAARVLDPVLATTNLAAHMRAESPKIFATILIVDALLSDARRVAYLMPAMAGVILKNTNCRVDCDST